MTRGLLGNKKCSKGFPKSFSEQTLLAHNGYPVYCRRASVGTPMTIPDPRSQTEPKCKELSVEALFQAAL
jgi:hypothetical protein